MRCDGVTAQVRARARRADGRTDGRMDRAETEVRNAIRDRAPNAVACQSLLSFYSCSKVQTIF